jgi:signal transduction histidine kinase
VRSRTVEPAATERARSTRGGSPSSDPATLDFQTLLAHTVGRLGITTGSERVVAWALRDDEPYVAAAAFRGDPPLAPDALEFANIARLIRAERLDCDPLLHEIGTRHGLTAAAPVPGEPDAPAALLLLGADPLRPRTLAALASAARRLETPLAASAAARRLAQLDAEVRRLDRLASLGSLTAEIAHEVRNPLVSVKTFLQLLPDRRDDPELFEQFLPLVSDELRRVERLLDAVIEHARPDQPSDEGRASDPAAVLESTLALLGHRADKEQVGLEFQISEALPGLTIDDDALRQVLLNLVHNAIEATPAGGKVTVVARPEAARVIFEIADEGPGIADELREAVFTPFYSTKRHQAGGLGLAITRRITLEAGGSISADARDSGGTTFRVALPATEKTL